MRDSAAPAAAPAALADHEVVERVRAGDTALFEILMRRYNQRLFRVARGIAGDDGEAEEVVQEAWLRAYRGLDGFRGEAAFATWLTRIAVHEASGRRRRGRRLALVGGVGDPRGSAPEPADRAPDPEHEMENRELQAALGAAVDALPAHLRAVFVLREVEGLSAAETAAALELSAANERVRLHRAKALLHRELDRRIGRETRRLYLFDGERCDRIVTAVLARVAAV